MQGVEIHIYLIFRQRTGYQFSVATQNVASVGRHFHVGALLPRCHVHPILLVCGHYIERLAHYYYGDKRHYDCDTTISRHYLAAIEFPAHFSGTLII